MSHKTPGWWYKDAGVASLLLSPVSSLYGLAVRYRWQVTEPYNTDIPVICIGNFTMGGAGKTPAAIYLAELLKELGERPVFLTRGYGGQIRGPHLVDLTIDKSVDVGDEPLLLARTAPTLVSADRPEGARFLSASETLSPTVIIMDDGFQNPRLKKDLNIIVVDGERGIGNGKIFPAGPLRENIGSQIKRADIIITIGGNKNFEATGNKALNIKGSISPKMNSEQGNEWQGKSVIAYSGIASPAKFYKTLRDLGAQTLKTFDFPDHHPFTANDADQLLKEAEKSNVQLVTTEKDLVRLDSTLSPFSELKEKSKALPIELKLEHQEKEQLLALVSDVLKR
ncbi:MAG: tetraacyldisaccharide 4'-kinase [Methyloligellaceae bacterium]